MGRRRGKLLVSWLALFTCWTAGGCGNAYVDDVNDEELVIDELPPPVPSGIVPAPVLAGPSALAHREQRTRPPARTIVRIACDSVGMDIVQAALVPGFAGRNPGLDLVATETAVGDQVRQLVGGQSTLAISSTPLRHSDRRNGLKGRVLARVSFVAIVHPESRLTHIGRARLRSVLCGQERTWLELAGSAATIHVVSANEPWQRIALQRLFPGGTIAPSVEVDSTKAAIEHVAAHRNAVAFVPQARVGQARVRVLAIDGVRADANSVRTRRYPLACELWLIQQEQSGLAALKVVGWMGGGIVRKRLRGFGFVE